MEDFLAAPPLNQVAVAVIDMQEKLFPFIHNKEELAKKVQKTVAFCRRLKIPLIVTEQYPKGLGATLPDIVQALGDSYKPLTKTVFSCFALPEFVAAVERTEAETVVLVGIETHICVMQSALTGLSWGAHDIVVLADCVGSRTEGNHRLGLDRMRDEGVIISSMEMFFYEILGEAKTEEHKLVFDLLK